MKFQQVEFNKHPLRCAE